MAIQSFNKTFSWLQKLLFENKTKSQIIAADNLRKSEFLKQNTN
jgi:hypothetical protein